MTAWLDPYPVVYERPYELVRTTIGEMNTRIDETMERATESIDRLADIGRYLPGPSTPPAISLPDVYLSARAEPDAPNVDLLGAVNPFTLPDFVTLAFDEGITWGTAPTFTPTIASITIPNPPRPIDLGDAPVRPNIGTVAVPVAPALPTVSAPTLLEINVPQVVFPTLPTFDIGPEPQFEGTTPNTGIDYVEAAYSSTVLDKLRVEIHRMLSGGTGLHPAVELALFDRARAREDIAAGKAVDEAFGTFAARGFELPPGALVAAVDAIRERNHAATSTIARDILIQSAQWEIENLRTAVANGVALETITIGLHNAIADRGLRLAQAQVDAEVAAYNVLVAIFNAKQQARSVRVALFEAQLRAALAPLEANRLQIEAEQVKGQINEALVRTYVAQQDAVRVLIERFRAEVQAAQAQSDLERAKIEIYRGDVEAWRARVDARRVEFDAYEAHVRGEVAKAGIYDAEARAFASTVDAFQAGENVKLGRIGARRDALLASVTLFDSKVRGESDRVRGEVGAIQARAEGFRADLQRYAAELGADTSERGMLLQSQEARLRNALAGVEIASRQYDNAQARLLQQAGLMKDALTAVGSMTSQLAAGAMSALHVSTSMSGTASAVGSSSNSYSLSETRQL